LNQVADDIENTAAVKVIIDTTKVLKMKIVF